MSYHIGLGNIADEPLHEPKQSTFESIFGQNSGNNKILSWLQPQCEKNGGKEMDHHGANGPTNSSDKYHQNESIMGFVFEILDLPRPSQLQTKDALQTMT